MLLSCVSQSASQEKGSLERAGELSNRGFQGYISYLLFETWLGKKEGRKEGRKEERKLCPACQGLILGLAIWVSLF